MAPTHDSPSGSDTERLSPYNDRPLCRYATLLAIKTLRAMRPRTGSVLMLTDRLCVKYGQGVHLAEASTLRFIQEHTSLPVPKVVCAFTHHDQTYIVMERIDGEMIGSGWTSRSDKSKSRLLGQLRSMIAELRQLQPPAGMGVASVESGSLFDVRIHPSMRFGPFADVEGFHRHLRNGLGLNAGLDPDIQTLIELQSRTWPLKLTHGDLSSLNILVRGDDIVGIVDWENAGWLPEYWEYTSACQVNPQNSFWIEEVDKFLTPMPQELEMERLRQKYFADMA